MRPFYQAKSGGAENTIVNIYNLIVQALNTETKLPKYILILPDRDVILQMNFFKPGLLHLLEKCMAWLGKTLKEPYLPTEKKLRDILPGSMGPEPTIIGVGMINHPFIRNHPFKTYNLVVDFRTKFNQILQSEAKKSRFALVLRPTNTLDYSHHFDNFGNLTFSGKKEYWRFLDSKLKNHDRNEELLSTDMDNTKVSTRPAHNRGDGYTRAPLTSSEMGHSNADIWGQAAVQSRLLNNRNKLRK